MRRGFSDQTRFDCQTIPDVQLNLNCREGLQYIYSQPQLRTEILNLVAQDVNEDSRSDTGRDGLDYWHITVLAAIRLGCNLDYANSKTSQSSIALFAKSWALVIGNSVSTSMPDALGTTFVCSKPKLSKPSVTGSSMKLSALS